MRIVLLSLLLLALLFVGPLPARAGVDAEVSIAFSANGTLQPADEEEVFRFDATAGTLISLSASISHKGDLSVELRHEGGQQTRTSGTDVGKISWKGEELRYTGTWILTITSDAAGNYKLKLKGKPVKKLAWAGLQLGASSGSLLDLSAPAGSIVKLSVKPAKGSGAEPRFGMLDGEDLTATGKFSVKGHKTVTTLENGGDLKLELTNLSATAGAVVVKISIKAPKPVKQKLDVRGAALGKPEGGGTYLSRMVVAGAGRAITVADISDPLHRSEVYIDGGALARDTTVTIASDDDLPPPASYQLAGPAVKLGPAGTAFSAPAVVTLPYDPGMLPPDADPFNALRIVHVSPGGGSQTLAPTQVDTKNETVSVQTSSFSTFQAVIPKGPPNLEGREYWHLLLEMEIQPGPGSFDSRFRDIIFGLGSTTLGPGGNVAWDLDERTIGFQHNDSTHTGVVDGQVSTSTDSDSGTGDWDYTPSKQGITVNLGDGDLDYAVSEDGMYLVSGWEDGDFSGIAVELLVEKAEMAPTAASLAGDYWICSFEAGASGPGNVPARLEVFRTLGSANLKANGTFTTSQDEFSSIFHAPDHPTSFLHIAEDFANDGTFSVEGNGTVILAFDDDGDIEETRFHPGKGGEVLLGWDKDSLGTLLDFMILVRKGSGMGAASMEGNWRTYSFELDPRTYATTVPVGGPYTRVGDWQLWRLRTLWAFDGTNDQVTVTDTDQRTWVRHTGESDGVLVTDSSTAGPSQQAFTLKGSGAYDHTGAEGDDLKGVVAPGGTFGFGMDDIWSGISLHAFDFFVKLPPPQN